MAFNFNTPSKIFRAFGGLFVLFGGGFYMARRIVSHRRANDLDNHRARESPRGLSMLPFRGLNDQRMQAKSRATTRAQVRKRTDGRRPWSACVSTFASARGVATAGPSWSYKLRRTSGQTQTPRNGVDTGARCLQLEREPLPRCAFSTRSIMHAFRRQTIPFNSVTTAYNSLSICVHCLCRGSRIIFQFPERSLS
ncbi:hypothetical protein DFH07DRAFT_839594 [Mycena maculata]|uniref:Uncharacterized protein n=1 Tax=Mycena maculata TaxID=230809 RepID=A0AAD7IEG3_9AGAR|nr:hypothetical protein DFH07DRAFT_839594 [Mycena maculata]